MVWVAHVFWIAVDVVGVVTVFLVLVVHTHQRRRRHDSRTVHGSRGQRCIGSNVSMDDAATSNCVVLDCLGNLC